MNPVAAIMYREFRIRTTSLTWLFFDLFVPLAYLLLFGIALDRAFSGGTGHARYDAFVQRVLSGGRDLHGMLRDRHQHVVRILRRPRQRDFL